MSSKVEPVRVVWMTGRTMVTLALVVAICSVIVGGDFAPDVIRAWRVAALVLAVAGVAIIVVTGRRAGTKAPVTKEWTASASTTIHRPPGEVWDVIRPAETATLLDPAIERASLVPGTPRGVGEQQEFVSRCPDGTLMSGIVEVVAEEPGRWAEVHTVTGPPTRQIYRVDAVPDGTELAYELTITALRWSPHRRHPKRLAAEVAETYVSNVKRVVEALPTPMD